MNIFSATWHGVEWFGKEVAHLVTEVPEKLNKLITLSTDAQAIASDAAKEVITLSGDVTALVVAVAKDDGASLAALEALIAAATAAGSEKLLNFVDDAAVFAALTTFFKTFNGANYKDVLSALANTIADGKSLSTSVIKDFEKLATDAAS